MLPYTVSIVEQKWSHVQGDEITEAWVTRLGKCYRIRRPRIPFIC
jgi:hypothetical protein